MDIFKRSTSIECDSYDIFCKYVSHSRKENKRLKKIVTKLSRTRLKRQLEREING